MGETMRDRQKSADLLRAFRETREQVQKSFVDTPNKTKFSRGYTETKKRQSSTSRAKSFDDKYSRLEEEIDSFNSYDLMYFFQRKASENGVKYVIANIKRDLGVFKKLLGNYTAREICLMIEFIFTSDQNYLDKSLTQPTVLISGYCNKIYHDSMLWVEDEYFPTEDTPKKSKSKPQREWNRQSKNDSANIGDWE